MRINITCTWECDASNDVDKRCLLAYWTGKIYKTLYRSDNENCLFALQPSIIYSFFFPLFNLNLMFYTKSIWLVSHTSHYSHMLKQINLFVYNFFNALNTSTIYIFIMWCMVLSLCFHELSLLFCKCIVSFLERL